MEGREGWTKWQAFVCTVAEANSDMKSRFTSSTEVLRKMYLLVGDKVWLRASDLGPLTLPRCPLWEWEACLLGRMHTPRCSDFVFFGADIRRFETAPHLSSSILL